MEKQRTPKQNRSEHKLFRLYADALNDAGMDMRKTLKPETWAEIDIPWTSETFKEHIWKVILKAQTGKDSTTEMTTKEIDEVFETLNRHAGEKWHIHVDFPSKEDIGGS